MFLAPLKIELWINELKKQKSWHKIWQLHENDSRRANHKKEKKEMEKVLRHSIDDDQSRDGVYILLLRFISLYIHTRDA